MLRVDNFFGATPVKKFGESTHDGISVGITHSMVNPDSGRFDTQGDHSSPEVRQRVKNSQPMMIEESMDSSQAASPERSPPGKSIFNPR